MKIKAILAASLVCCLAWWAAPARRGSIPLPDHQLPIG